MLSKTKVINRVLLVPIDEIKSNPNQPRRFFDQEKLDELAMSISQYGLLQPISLQQLDKNQYELIAGERRLLACKQLKMLEIPAIVIPMKQEDSAALALIENIQRSSLNYFEEALAIQNLMSMLGVTQQVIAKRLGKTQSTIANKLRLLKYSPDLQDLLLKNNLSERHARAILPLINSDKLIKTVNFIAEHQLNVAQTEQYIEKILENKQPKRKPEIVFVKDFQVFVDTVNQAADIMKLAGIKTTTNLKEDDEEFIYTIKIKKKSFI